MSNAVSENRSKKKPAPAENNTESRSESPSDSPQVPLNFPPSTTKLSGTVASDDSDIVEFPLEALDGLYAVLPGEHPFYMNRTMVCLDANGHTSGVRTSLCCPNEEQYVHITWQGTLTDQHREMITDLVDAAEKSALGISFLTLPLCTGFNVVRQAKRKTGFDYFLSQSTNDERRIFHEDFSARLEVTGMLHLDTKEKEKRFKEKFVRAEKYDQYKTLPIYVCLVEHSSPKIEVRTRHA